MMWVFKLKLILHLIKLCNQNCSKRDIKEDTTNRECMLLLKFASKGQNSQSVLGGIKNKGRETIYTFLEMVLGL